MSKEDQYIKSIEKYFLSHLGKGIMLTYSDYELIQSWKDREIPVEVVIEGINEAFLDTKNFDVINNQTKIRNLSYINNYINKSFEIFLRANNSVERIDPNYTNSYLDKIIERINLSQRDIENDSVLNEVNLFKHYLISLSSDKDSDLFHIIMKKELELYEKIFNLLSEQEKNTILSQCESKLVNKNNLTPNAYKKSIISFRNEMIKKKYNLNFMS